MERLSAIYAAFIAAGILVSTPWFFGGYQQEDQNKVLGTAVFGFIFTITSNRLWVMVHIELGHQPHKFIADIVPQALGVVALGCLLVMASQCKWLGGRWWVLVASCAFSAFVWAQAV